MSLSWRVRLSYAVGHVLNDLCASVWFTYTLVFFKFGVNVPTTLAGTVVLVGQLADGLATPLVGYFSDRSHRDQSRPAYSPDQYERLSDEHQTSSDDNVTVLQQRCGWRCFSWCPQGRKAWHFGGSLLVIFSFPLIFGSPVGSMNASTWAKMIYYLPFVTLFQFGWAAVQITHLAMMNDLTLDPGERTLLTSLRHLFTVLCNLSVYLSTYFLLGHHTDPVPPTPNSTVTSSSAHPTWNMVLAGHPGTGPLSTGFSDSQEGVDFGPDDLPAFRNLSLAIISAGALMTLVFHLGLHGSHSIYNDILAPTETTNLSDTDALSDMRYPGSRAIYVTSWKGWLRVPLFWVEGFSYMTIRLIVNVSQAYITVYLLHSLLLPKETMALVPLTIYMSSMVSLIVQKPIQDKISRELNAVLGLSIITCFCVLVNYPGDPVDLVRVYIAAGILGIGCTFILITGLSMVSDLIGPNQENGAFVYGYMSFADKLVNGIVIQLIESLWNSTSCSCYYQNVESYGIGGWVVAGVLFLAIQVAVKKRTYGQFNIFLATRFD
ncbi:hypothetical protein EG68_06723 [Paragonimus skrjabini miyazakii]|uniref:Major facilitator superfamily domain-containing protein 12-like n=1 Tax=Paragonimus skrjabini miyazakii TaxID=59628 RepID=A0A8S9YSY4_9TREM|nr:hypothetical protein EG68_06723 [Paragonimus skrjabini miyazakii]